VKEDDRVRQIEAVNAETGPVMVAYPDAPEIDAILAAAARGPAEVDVIWPDGVRHQMWPVTDDADRGAHQRGRRSPALHCHWHHRSAAAGAGDRARGNEPESVRYFSSAVPGA
jgi:uncharacterized protein (DUF1015 family)